MSFDLKPPVLPSQKVYPELIDAGYHDGMGEVVRLECEACGWRSGWLPQKGNLVESENLGDKHNWVIVKPCPKCNKEDT